MLKMSEKHALTATLVRRYEKADKKTKTDILNEFVKVTGYNRSYARRKLRAGRHRDYRVKKVIKRERVKKYGEEIIKPLGFLWETSNYLCGKRLEPLIPEYLWSLKRDGVIEVEEDVEEKLLAISAATIDRALKGERDKYQLKKGRSATKPGTLLKQQIPIRTFADWDEKVPGFFEMDLVAFCGGSLKGDFIYGLDMTDIATGWVCLEAVWNKGQEGIHQAVDRIRRRLVFRMLGLDCDNGSEFINQILYRYTILHRITFTRGRPGNSNDNCYVEQKNYTTLRTFVGYDRLDNPEVLPVVQELLLLVEIYVNFFQSSARLISKTRKGAKVTKKHDKPMTPYKRLCKSGTLSKRQRQQLYQIYISHNPHELKQKITKLQTKIVKMTRSHSVTI